MLRSPSDRTPLYRKNDNGVSVYTSESGSVHKTVDGVPVLVDFENSVLSENHINESGLASPVDCNKYSGLSGLAKKLVSRDIKATVQNVEILLKEVANKPSSKVLIVGGGAIGNGMSAFYNDPDIELISFDIYASTNVQFVADAHNIPLSDESVDFVIIQAVLEHVLEPIKVVDEIHRVLKHDGVVYAETPFLQQVHEAAYDFTRFTESGHRYLFKKFETIYSGVAGGAGTALMWSIEYFFRGLFRSKLVGKLAKLSFFWLQYMDQWLPTPYAIDAASGVYFMGKKSTVEITPSQIISHYQGAYPR